MTALLLLLTILAWFPSSAKADSDAGCGAKFCVAPEVAVTPSTVCASDSLNLGLISPDSYAASLGYQRLTIDLASPAPRQASFMSGPRRQARENLNHTQRRVSAESALHLF